MLAFGPVTYFREEQRFRESWLWVVIAIPMAFALWALLVTPGTPLAAGIAVIGVAIAVSALIGLAYLETTVTADAVIVRFHVLCPTRRIKLDDIAEYAPMHYTMWDSGGWGVHFRLANGSQVLVGSQRSAELALAIAKAMAGRRTA